MNDFLLQLQAFLNLMMQNLPLTLMLVGVLWGIHFINFLVGYRLNVLGIYPRHLLGLVGIPFSPLLHGDFNHLFFNSIPLIVLVDFMLTGGVPRFVDVTLTIILISGMLTWLMGRRALHVGASSLIIGYWSYLLLNAYENPSASTILLAIVCIYYFGGFLLQLFPQEEKVSWEGHLFGFLAGLAAAFLFR